MADQHLIAKNRLLLEELKTREEQLERQWHHFNRNFAGLIDLDLTFNLVKAKLELALAFMAIQERVYPGGEKSYYGEAQTRAIEGISLFEALTKENVSLDQQELIRKAPEVEDIKDKIKKILMLGGPGFFDKRIDDDKKRRQAARVIHNAIEKFIAPDDRYEQLFKTEELPGFFRRLVLKYLPVLAKEHQQEPPYGIEEGEEEEVYYADKIKMPLSQAVYYLENEVLPGLAEKLKENPGDRSLQQKIRVTQEKLNEYRNIHITPIVRPLVPEKGMYTDTYSSYTLDGELLVSMPVSVKFKSGTNLDRIQCQVKAEIVRNLAGKGIHAGLDNEYKRLKKIESGIAGSCRTPGLKINTEEWFIPLKKEIPMLALVEDKKDFLMLINTITSGTKKHALQYIEDMLNLETSGLAALSADAGSESGEKGKVPRHTELPGGSGEQGTKQ